MTRRLNFNLAVEFWTGHKCVAGILAVGRRAKCLAVSKRTVTWPSLLAVALLTSPGLEAMDASNNEQEIQAAAQLTGYVEAATDKCAGLIEHPGALAAYYSNHRIYPKVITGAVFQAALERYRENHAGKFSECTRALVGSGPHGDTDHLFDLAEGEAGTKFLAQVAQSEQKAAINYRLAANARNICGLLLRDQELLFHLLQDGIDIHFLRMIRGGEVPTKDQESNPNFQLQQTAWSNADRLIREYPNVRSYCHSMWDMFGPSGSEYSGVLSNPEVPYSPDELQ